MSPEATSAEVPAGAADLAQLGPEEARKRLRRLNSRAAQLKLDLHDLSEELPLGWEQIPDLARRTYDAYAEIALLEGLAEKETSG